MRCLSFACIYALLDALLVLLPTICEVIGYALPKLCACIYALLDALPVLLPLILRGDRVCAAQALRLYLCLT
jgi:hypothetical protein